jgi:hypothetical protein
MTTFDLNIDGYEFEPFYELTPMDYINIGYSILDVATVYDMSPEELLKKIRKPFQRKIDAQLAMGRNKEFVSRLFGISIELLDSILT